LTDCLFCRIASGDVPSKMVAETPDLIAFRDIAPQAPTHILIVPRRHVAASAAELALANGALLGEVFALASRIAGDEGLESGWRLVTNVGPDAGQSVFHLHFHLVGGAPLGRFGA
jgi:histidine triad (HIT) family protein